MESTISILEPYSLISSGSTDYAYEIFKFLAQLRYQALALESSFYHNWTFTFLQHQFDIALMKSVMNKFSSNLTQFWKKFEID